MKTQVKVKTLAHFKGKLPCYQTEFSSGCDIEAALDSVDTELRLAPGKRVLIPTGLIFEIPQGYEIQVRPRSGLALKHGVTVLNSPGTIDSDFRGELKILLINLGENEFRIKSGDRIAQLILSKVVTCQFEISENLTETLRSDGGYGSTGTNLGSVGSITLKLEETENLLYLQCLI